MSTSGDEPASIISLSDIEKRVRKRVSFNVGVLTKSGELGYMLEWIEWSARIPFIKFDQDWNIRVVPPSYGAMVRFHVKNQNDYRVSVYLDCHDILGSLRFTQHDDPNPYWEIYPYQDGDIYRVAMDNVEELLEAIRESFKYQESHKDKSCE